MKILCFRRAVAGLFAIALVATQALAQDATDFETKAEQALMVEASTGTILLSKGEAQTIPPASLAKLMTMEVVFDALTKGEISLDTEYTVSEHAWRTGGAPSRTSTMFAAIKSSIRVEDLIRGVIIQMANDGCIILAEGMEGSEEAFAARMNLRAAEIGMKDSHFANPTGLPDPQNKTTLEDMVTLARHLHTAYPQYYSLYATPDFEWNNIFQRNRNRLLYTDLGVDGLATGYADESGFAIVVSAERNGVRLFLGLSGLKNDRERNEEAIRVLQWGQTNFERKSVFKKGEVIGQASVYGSAEGHVDLLTVAPVEVYVPVLDPNPLSGRIVYHWPLRPPVRPGQEIAQLRVFSGDRLLREVPLETASAVGVGTLRQRAMDAIIEMLFFWL